MGWYKIGDASSTRNPKKAALAVPLPTSVAVKSGCSPVGPSCCEANPVTTPSNVNGTVNVCRPSTPPVRVTDGVVKVPLVGNPKNTSG